MPKKSPLGQTRADNHVHNQAQSSLPPRAQHTKMHTSPLRALIMPIYVPSVIYAMGTGAVNPVLALAALAVGFNTAGSSAVVGIFGAVAVLLSPPVGTFINWVGDRTALITGSLISIAALLASLWALWLGESELARVLLVIVVILLSLGANIWSLARQAYVSETVPVSHRARAMSTFGGMVRLGNLAGPLAATAALSLWALHSVFLVQLVCVLISLALIMVFIVPPAPSSSSAAQLHDSTANTPAAQQEIFYTHKHSNIFSTVMMGIGVNALTVLRANRNVIVPLWGTYLGLPEHFITGTFAVTALLDTMMFAVSGILMDKRGRLWALVPSLAIMPLAIATMVLWRDAVGFIVGAALLGFGNGFGSGIIMTTGADLAPAKNKASFLGIWQAIVAIGTAGGPFIISGLTAAVSLAAGMWATAAIGIFGLVWLVVFIKPAYRRLGIDVRGNPLKH